MIAFQNFKRTVFGKSKHSERSPLKNLTYDQNSLNQQDILQQQDS